MTAESIYKKKAKENFALARSCRATHPNASASRIYYALFQGAVGEFVRLGISPQKIDRGAADAMGERGQTWTHSFVKNNAKLAGLDARECSLLKTAYALRITADYEALEVDPDDVNDLLNHAQKLLESLGVDVKGV